MLFRSSGLGIRPERAFPHLQVNSRPPHHHNTHSNDNTSRTAMQVTNQSTKRGQRRLIGSIGAKGWGLNPGSDSCVFFTNAEEGEGWRDGWMRDG